jgi:cytochrome b
VWDAPVRLLHWLLVAAIAAAWITSGSTGPLHAWIGYAALALIGARLVWGFAGSAHARFADFVKPPRAVAVYLRRVAAGDAPRHLGHNPAGGAMVLALLSGVALVAISGWALGTDLLWGYAWPVRVHTALAWSLAALIVLHVAGVALTSWQHRENLVAAMVHGDKEV